VIVVCDRPLFDGRSRLTITNFQDQN